MTEITLTWYEAAMASEIGRLRHLASLKSNLTNRHGYDGTGWSENIEGACGELALAKHLNLYWSGSVNTFSAPDVGKLQVRTRSRHEYELIVRPDDDDMAQFVLVTGRCPTYRVRGWIRGDRAKRVEWSQAYAGRPAAFFVPQDALCPDFEGVTV